MRCNYNLSYFNLWWKRMQREGEREGKERIKREEDTKKREMFKRLLRRKSKARKTAQLSEVDKNDRNELTHWEQMFF